MADNKAILPGSTIGILGGGQLGRMMALEGKRMGYDIICLDPAQNAPCAQVADKQVVGGLGDLAAAKELAEQVDVLVYEFENLDVNVVQELENNYRLPQGSKILGIAQDRIAEKTNLRDNGFPVVPFAVVYNAEDLDKAVAEIGLPSVLKTARGGYDGKGQFVLRSAEDVARAREEVSKAGVAWVLEQFISFSCEVSAIVARNAAGETSVFPIGENIHKENILHLTIVPARVPAEIQQQAEAVGKKIAEAFGVVGLLAIEFFVTENGVVVNELAPRPHNSGHYTWEGCYTSQFEQLLRAVCNLPFGSTELVTPVVMINVLGADVPAVLKHMPHFPDNVKVHLYGKDLAKLEPKRKMGHLTFQTDNAEQAIEWFRQISE